VVPFGSSPAKIAFSGFSTQVALSQKQNIDQNLTFLRERGRVEGGEILQSKSEEERHYF